MASRSFSYYPGCSMHSSAREYEASTQAVFGKLGIQLQEIPGWTCCGASSAHSMSKLLGHALPARNLQLAASIGLPLTSSCPACFSRLKFTSRDLARDAELLAAVSEAIGQKYTANIDVLPFLATLTPEDVAAAVTRPLEGLKVACYYGCLFVRPGDVTGFDDEENPTSMDRLLAAAGAQPVEWSFRTECCGTSMAIARPGEVERLSGRILAAAKKRGADCVAVTCALCQGNLDQRQGAISSRRHEDTHIPVLYFTQLLGLALGFSAREMMLDRHFTDPVPVLKTKGLV